MAKELGIAHEFHTPDEVTRLYPLVSLKGVVGALYTPDNGHVGPAMATQSLAIGACQRGAEINCHTKVVDFAQRPGGEWDVEIDKGTIAAGVVVNATGLRSDEIAALAGNFLPLVAIQLQHLVTEAIPEVADLETELPVLGGLDGSFYLRQELDGILTGVYEEKPVFWAIDGIPPPRLWSGHLARKPGARRKKRRRCPSPRARPRLGGDQEYQPSVAPPDAPPTPKA